MQDFRQLRVWSDSVELCVDLYEVTSRFGTDERFGLVSQIRRASVSVAANIAEGASRPHAADFSRFLGYAVSSASEVESHLEISKRLGLLNDGAAQGLVGRVVILRRSLIRLMLAVQRSGR